MTRYEAHIEKHWETHGLAHLVVARVRADHSAELAVFLVDTLCLGVKDAYFESDIPESALAEYLERNLPPENERIHPACAKKLVEGAVAYAQSLGFAPHRDFKKARKVLSGLDASTCPRDFTFGRDGRPCYVRGPDDSDERVDRVLAILAARCGEDGYDYIDADAEEEDDLDAPELRADLIRFLSGEPASVPRFYELTGLITAMQLCPTAVSPMEIFDVLWGPGGKAWSSPDALQQFTRLLMAQWNQIANLIAHVRTPGAHPEDTVVDVYLEDFDALVEDHGDEAGALALLNANTDWCRGFLCATLHWPAHWRPSLARADLAPHWEILDLWTHVEHPEKIAAAAKASSPRTLASSANILARALRPPFASDGSSN